MNDRAPANKWNLINKMWIDHIENPKYSGDLSTCGIYLSEEPENILKVNHSFILNNSRKLNSLNSEIMCMLPDGVIPLEEFAKNIIAKKYNLPKQPKEFHLGSKNKIVEIRHSQFENQDEQQKIETSEGSLSNLIPFGTKITETIKNTNQTENKNYKKVKLASLIALPILAMIIIITFVISPTDKSKALTNKNKIKTKKLNTARLKTSSNKSATKKSKRKITEVKNKIKKRTTSSTKNSKYKSSIQKKKKSRRKDLMKNRQKTLPASINGSDSEYEDSIDEDNYLENNDNDNYDEEQEDQSNSEDNYNDIEGPEDTMDEYDDQEPNQEHSLDSDQGLEDYDAEQIAPENDLY